MSEIRKLPAAEPRVECGPVQFGDDWPGTFIRGDSAGWYALLLNQLLERLPPGADGITFMQLRAKPAKSWTPPASDTGSGR